MTHFKSAIVMSLIFVLPASGKQNPGKAPNMEKISVQRNDQSPKLKKHGISIVWDKEKALIHGAFFLPKDITDQTGTGNIHERLVLVITSGLINFTGYIAPDSAVFDDDVEETRDGLRGWFSFPADLLTPLQKDRRFFYTVSFYTYKSNTLRWPFKE